MKAVEHLKTLCCLGLPAESAMIAATPLLHEIIPHGWMRAGLIEPDATISGAYAENPEAVPVFRERLWRFMEDPTALASLWMPAVRAVSIGWTLSRQGGTYLESAYYREIEAPLDACWILGAMIGAGGRTIGFVQLTRPRSARPFTVDDVQRLDPLRPWLAHAFQRSQHGDGGTDEEPSSAAGGTLLSGRLIMTQSAKVVHQTAGVEYLLMVLSGEPCNFTRHKPARDRLPAPVLRLMRQITGAASGASSAPPRMRVPTAYGVLTLEAKWLVPAGTLALDAVRDPGSCLIAVTIELHENPLAHAIRILRDNGATPAQTKVGVRLALGKTKPEIAGELGIQPSSVADLTKKLYQTLDIHNSAGLGARIWLNEKQPRAH